MAYTLLVASCESHAYTCCTDSYMKFIVHIIVILVVSYILYVRSHYRCILYEIKYNTFPIINITSYVKLTLHYKFCCNVPRCSNNLLASSIAYTAADGALTCRNYRWSTYM